MKGAIFYATKYGSTADYARWIAEATGLPAFDIAETSRTPAEFDFLVLGSPIIYFKPIFHRWVAHHMADFSGKPLIFFTVSGAPAGEKLDRWIEGSLPKAFVARAAHVALGGRQTPEDLALFDRVMLQIGGWMNRDKQAGREERQGFDHVDRNSIAPVVALVDEIRRNEAEPPKAEAIPGVWPTA